MQKEYYVINKMGLGYENNKIIFSRENVHKRPITDLIKGKIEGDIFIGNMKYHIIRFNMNFPERDESGSSHLGISQCIYDKTCDGFRFIPGWTEFDDRERKPLCENLEKFAKEAVKHLS